MTETPTSLKQWLRRGGVEVISNDRYEIIALTPDEQLILDYFEIMKRRKQWRN